jgi:hypothetical protein
VLPVHDPVGKSDDSRNNNVPRQSPKESQTQLEGDDHETISVNFMDPFLLATSMIYMTTGSSQEIMPQWNRQITVATPSDRLTIYRQKQTTFWPLFVIR